MSVAFDKVEHFLYLDGFACDEGVESGARGDCADTLNGCGASDSGLFGGQELEDDGGGLLIGADEQSLKDLQHRCAAVAIAE